MKKLLVVAVPLAMFGGVAGVYATVRYTHRQPAAKTPVATPQTQPVAAVNAKPNNQTDTFNKKQYSTTDPASLWFINNKVTGLPLDYVPIDLVVPGVSLRLAATQEQMQLRKIAQTDLEHLFADAKQAALQMQFGSGYRSAKYQKTLYDGYVASGGKAEADRVSARPGHSEHQTGLALDFTRADGKCHLEACFGDQPEGKWLAENAYKYGFILRYTTDKESVTGYKFEPWHYRYVGKDLAAEMQKQHIATLEEYFDTGAAPDYIDQ